MHKNNHDILMPLFPPLNFNVVEDGLYRSGVPFELNFEVILCCNNLLIFCFNYFSCSQQFLKTLNLRSVIVLSSNCIDDSSLKFFEENNIRAIYIENSVNDSLRGLFPIAEEMVTESLKVLSEKQNYPLLVICKTGKSLTGVVMACLRKLQHWSLISIFEEYRRFAGGSRLQQQHEQFIELFDTDLIPLGESAPDFLK